MWMRVVEADHIQTAVSGGPPRVDVTLGIELEPMKVASNVGDSHSFGDLLPSSNQDAAAFGGQSVAGVQTDRIERRSCNSDGYNASTSIAIPMPPPMHNEATP